MEQSYLESFVVGSKLQCFLVLAKNLCVDKDAPARVFRGLLKIGIHQRGKDVHWVKVVVVTCLSTHRQDLPSYVNFFQVSLFSITHHLLSILTIHIFVDASRE